MARRRTDALTRSDPGGLWSLTVRAAADALAVYVECDELAQAEAMARRLTRGGNYTVARHGPHGAVVELHPAPGHGLDELAEFAAERLERWSLAGLARGNSIAFPPESAQDRGDHADALAV